MSRLKLEEFELSPVQKAPVSAAVSAPIGEAQTEEDKLEAFENGYKAGWDDAARSHSENLEHVSVELGRNLQELSFTFHEARTQILKDMRAVFEELLAKILPEIANGNLPAIIAEQIAVIAQRDAQTKIELRVHPSNIDVVTRFVAAQSFLQVEVMPEPSFGEGQARLLFADGEQNIDLSEVLTLAEEKTQGFFNHNEKAG
ncbi:hypothetical protein [Halocynthiibacter sp.]|uniref:hypothetical protein n=1 Tax=Halocynthiibacter sp. TaxID=1979210 RepID=UPI003C4E982F